MTAKPPSVRLQELRERRTKLGLVRLELYAHPEDHDSLKFLCQWLHVERQMQTLRDSYGPEVARWNADMKRAYKALIEASAKPKREKAKEKTQ